jgi:hypothetical protein
MSDVANTILTQLGGRRFLTMTGAKHLVGSADALSMQLPNAICNGKKCTGVRIVLAPSDTYSVEAIVIRNHEYKILDTRHDVYVENLRDVIIPMSVQP